MLKKALTRIVTLAILLCVCISPLSAAAEGAVNGSTVLNTYHTLVDRYNTFVDLHEAFYTRGQDVPAEVVACYPGINLTIDNLYATGTAKSYFSTLDTGTLGEINAILTEDIAYMDSVIARLQAAETNGLSYPAGDYKPGTVYGPKLTQAELDEVASAVSRFASCLPLSGMSDTDKVLAAHDYLVQFCSYAPDWSKNRANTAWGALIYGEAQCSGYARAMKALCDSIGVGCYYVHADDKAANPSHQWNVVQVDGQWYIVDVQCNDSSGFDAALLVSDSTFAAMGPSWDRSAVPACASDYAGEYYHYVFFQRMDNTLFAARMI